MIMTLDKKTNEYGRIIQFIMKTDKYQESILNKMTAKHTFAVKQYLELFENEEESICPFEYGWDKRIRELTITTRNRAFVKYDFKELTTLNTTSLAACFRQAMKMYKSYKTHLKKWEKRTEKASITYTMKSLSNLEFSDDSQMKTITDIEEIINQFSKSLIW